MEVEVAIMVHCGGEEKPTGTRMSFCYRCFLFCTKANCTYFIFLREDCRQLEIAAFYLLIAEELEGWGSFDFSPHL